MCVFSWLCVFILFDMFTSYVWHTSRASPISVGGCPVQVTKRQREQRLTTVAYAKQALFTCQEYEANTKIIQQAHCAVCLFAAVAARTAVPWITLGAISDVFD